MRPGRRSGFAVALLKLDGEFLVVLQVSVDDCQFAADPRDGMADGGREPFDDLLGRQLFQFANSLHPQEIKNLPCMVIVLEQQEQFFVSGNLGASQLRSPSLLHDRRGFAAGTRLAVGGFLSRGLLFRTLFESRLGPWSILAGGGLLFERLLLTQWVLRALFCRVLPF